MSQNACSAIFLLENNVLARGSKFLNSTSGKFDRLRFFSNSFSGYVIAEKLQIWKKDSNLDQRLSCSHDFKILHGGRIIECDAHYFTHHRLQFSPYVSTSCTSTRYLFHEIAKRVFSISCQPCLFYSAVKIVFYSTRSQFWQALKVAPDMWSWRKTHHLKALWLLFTVFALK